MLVLSLRPGDTVVCDNGLAFTLSWLRRGTARISIQAPDDVRVLRGCLLPPDLVESALMGRASLDELKTAFDEADKVRDKKHANPVQRQLNKPV